VIAMRALTFALTLLVLLSVGLIAPQAEAGSSLGSACDPTLDAAGACDVTIPCIIIGPVGIGPCD
jgi:hypothetical protein